MTDACSGHGRPNMSTIVAKAASVCGSRVRRGLIAFSLAVSLGYVVAAPSASAAVGPCTDVQIIGLRGSGENPPNPEQHGMGTLVGPVADEIALQVQDAGTVSFYGLPYKAGDASPKTVLSGSYFASKNAGSVLLHDYLAEVVAACPSTKLVVMGYSQGAHAAGDQLAREPTSITDHVAAFVMFGDPRFNPDASYTWGSFDSRDYGLNGKRDLGDFSSWNSRVFSFCNQNDVICQGIGKDHGTSSHAQALYVGNYSTLVAGLVRRRLGFPRPASARTPLDLAFVIDTTGSMGASIAGVKAAASNIAQTLKSRGSDFRIGLVDFKDHADQGDPYASRLDLQMTTDTAAFSNALDGLVADGGGDGPEAVYSGLMTAITDLSWRNVTRKSIILMGDAPAKDPEPFTGFTSRTVTDAARALDPATINPLVVGGAPAATFQGLADDSGGKVFEAPDPSQVAEQVVSAVDQAAVPLYTSLTVGTPARPGTAVQFSAAGSYYDAGEIISYAWDFNDDGVVDETTAANRTTHVYDAPFSGITSVTANTNDSQKASVTAAVDVREDAPLPPSSPTSLTVSSTQPGSIDAAWQPPSDNGGGSLVGYGVEIDSVTSGEIVYSATTEPSSTRLAVNDLSAGSYRVRVYAASDGGLGSAAEHNVDVSAAKGDGGPAPSSGGPAPSSGEPTPAGGGRTPTIPRALSVRFSSGKPGTIRPSRTGMIVLPRPTVSCPTTPPNCMISTIGGANLPSRGRRSAKARIGRSTVQVPTGRTVKVRFKLTEKAQSALRQARRMRATVTITASHSTRTTKKTISFILQARRPGPGRRR
jgi:Mg-chelatase subunit ChlD